MQGVVAPRDICPISCTRTTRLATPRGPERPVHVLVDETKPGRWEDRVLAKANSNQALPGIMIDLFRRGISPEKIGVYSRAEGVSVKFEIKATVTIPNVGDRRSEFYDEG